MVVKVKIFSDLSKSDDFFRLVDFVTDTVDLVVNPRYHSFDSDKVRRTLDLCGAEGPWTIIDGDVFEDGTQYVTVVLQNPEDFVKIKLFIPALTTNEQYKKEDLLC